MTPEMQIAELTERCRRLEAVLRGIAARAENWQRLETTEYYRRGLRHAYAEIAYTAQSGLAWAESLTEEPFL